MNRGAWWATWGHKKLDATEQLTLSLSKICQGARCVLSTRGIHMHSMMGMQATDELCSCLLDDSFCHLPGGRASTILSAPWD